MTPLRPTSPVPYDESLRVFVGYAPDRRLAFHVLEHGLRRRSLHRLDVRPIDARGLPVPRERLRGRPSFALARFEVPARCGHRGRALYLDPDVLVLGDVSALWALPVEGADLLHVDLPEERRGARFDAVLLDCARLDWSVERLVADLDAGRRSLDALLDELDLVPLARQRAAIPERWGPLAGRAPGEEPTLVRYAGADGPPWLRAGQPLASLWYRELFDALASGTVSRRVLDEEVQRGHVAPQVLAWARAALRARGAS